MHLFAQRIAAEDAPRAIDGQVVLAHRRVVRHQPRQCAQIQALQALPFDDAPVFITVDQQVSPIEADRLGVQRRTLNGRLRLLGKLAGQKPDELKKPSITFDVPSK